MPFRLSIAEYDRRHQLSAQLGDAVQRCYVQQADAPVAFLAAHFANKGRAGAVDRVVCREVLDARGVPQVEAAVFADGRQCGVASPGGGALLPRDAAPRDQPRGCCEVVDRRDAAPATAEAAAALRFAGKGCREVAMAGARAATEALRGVPVCDQVRCDDALLAADGTAELARLGANTVCAVSLAVAVAGAECRGVALWQHLLDARYRDQGVPPREVRMPHPIAWVLAPPPGGRLALRRLGVVPVAAGGVDWARRMDACAEVYHAVGRRLRDERPEAASVGAGGMYTFEWDSVEGAVDALRAGADAAAAAGLLDGVEMRLAVDGGGSGYQPPAEADTRGTYVPQEDGGPRRWEQLAAWYVALADRGQEGKGLPLAYLQDTHHWSDSDGFQLISAELAAKGNSEVVVCGGDLYATSHTRVREGREGRTTRAAELSLDEAATVSRLATAAVVWAPAGAPRAIVTGIRPNDTASAHAADLAVGMQAHFVSLGGVASAESVSKWSRLCDIEMEAAAAGVLAAEVCPALPAWEPPPYPPGSKDALQAAQGARQPSGDKKGKKK